MLTCDRLRALLDYSPDTGVFRWKHRPDTRPERNTRHAGKVAGCASRGRWVIRVDGRLHVANRLAWLYVTGAWPMGEVGHRDADASNNRWLNLRDVPGHVSHQNRHRANRRKDEALPLGVDLLDSGRYSARIGLHRKTVRLGTFETAQQAHAEYVAAKRRMHAGSTL